MTALTAPDHPAANHRPEVRSLDPSPLAELSTRPRNCGNARTVAAAAASATSDGTLPSRAERAQRHFSVPSMVAAVTLMLSRSLQSNKRSSEEYRPRSDTAPARAKRPLARPRLPRQRQEPQLEQRRQHELQHCQQKRDGERQKHVSPPPRLALERREHHCEHQVHDQEGRNDRDSDSDRIADSEQGPAVQAPQARPGERYIPTPRGARPATAPGRCPPASTARR